MKKSTIIFSLLAAVICLAAVYAVTQAYRYAHPARCPEQSHRYYGRKFNDMQNRHAEAAKECGIPEPLKDREEAESMRRKYRLKEVKTCRRYKVGALAYSVPYLTKDAARLLDDIGKNFQDSLSAKNILPHKIIVTSVLRTDKDVENLGKRNGNASKNSVHRYATTFDITYKSFEPVGYKWKETDTGTMKQVLAEVLSDLRAEGRCYVRYEKNQACFHITVRRKK
ncbi:MAG: DUF5715 family protein [Bacteroidales bacterium]|nr:DUF5715 family protein [Bacteroidales bacterium]